MSTSEARAAGRRWIADRSLSEVGAILDAMILGDFDWRDWFADPPPKGFRAGAYDAAREREERGI